MGPTPDRILRQRDVHAMVALDTVEALAERVKNLLAHSRRITTARRYATYTQQPPEVLTGQTVDDIHVWNKNGNAGISVRLKPGVMAGFGFAAYHYENPTEAGEWKRYHATENTSDDFFQRRRDMTNVEIQGGLPGDGPARDDKLVIRHWNKDGVCDEIVAAFDHGPDREDVARHLYLTDVGDDPEHRDLWDCFEVGDGTRATYLARAADLMDVINGKRAEL